MSGPPGMKASFFCSLLTFVLLCRYQYFVVDPLAEYNMPQYILREFKVTTILNMYSDTLRVL